MLNLIPPKQKKKLKLDLLNQIIVAFGLSVISVIFVLTLIFVIALVFLNINLSQIEKDLSFWRAKPEIKELEILENKVNEVNQELDFLEEYQKERLEFSLILEDFTQDVPEGIRFNSLSIEKKSRKINIQGHALTRDILLTFKNTLENASYVSNFEFPLSNLTKSEDVNFRLNFNLVE